MKSDIIDIKVVLHHSTDKAWLVSTDGDRDNAVWVPRSCGELELVQEMSLVPRRPAGYVLTVPERIAIDKELV